MGRSRASGACTCSSCTSAQWSGVRLRGRILELAEWLVRGEEGLVLPEQAEGLPRRSRAPGACTCSSCTSAQWSVVRLRCGACQCSDRLVGSEEGMVLYQPAEGMRFDGSFRLRGRIRELDGWLVTREEDLVLPEQA